jgi:SRSO17 transposase
MLLDQAQAWRVPHRCVVADADYGDNPNFLAGLEARQEQYIVGVRTDFQVSLGSMVTRPVWRADALLQTVARFRQEDGLRDHKQRLGIEECQARTKEPVLR